MRKFLLAGVPLLALTAVASASPVITFSYTSAFVDWTVANSGTYHILAFGDQAANGYSGGASGWISCWTAITTEEPL